VPASLAVLTLPDPDRGRRAGERTAGLASAGGHARAHGRPAAARSPQRTSRPAWTWRRRTPRACWPRAAAAS
jgi:hypothetical protein